VPKTAVIIGAGPAGLTAGLEFLRKSDIHPIILEASHEIGGISRTIRYKGNRMDIGGHRFFSKSDRVMQWWLDIMPVTGDAEANVAISYQNKSRKLTTTSAKAPAEDTDLVMLVRPRKSRIYFLRRFFDYPVKLTPETLIGLGPARTTKVGFSYLKSRVRQRKPEASLEDFLVNRFGRQLYGLFFESYTEKVWGVHPREISAEWGAQRIKGLSLTSAAKHFFQQALRSKKSSDLSQKKVETSLIEQFLYPKYGPGQLWEHVADLIQQRGGQVTTGMRVTKLHTAGDDKSRGVQVVEAVDDTGKTHRFEADYVISTMPVRHLVRALDCPVPEEVKNVSTGLVYRDFVTVGLLVNKLLPTEADGSPLKDTWIYIQEPDVKVGRLQIFNNWSPWLVADPTKVWIGLEYFCNDTDELWKMKDSDIQDFAIGEVEKIGILKRSDVLDGHVVRVPKTYPAYFGSYDRFDMLREFTDRFENLYLVGRNGMHKYNNQDHSMLTAMTAVDNIVSGNRSKDNIWSINTEMDYHEEKRS
jgi:protoporphyrinogen oxidase